ncbi:hypothetical protein Q5O89_23315 [Peribacillus frigoritolerans]|nr:hypothetical protein [Peribacillus frigoritolerans]
MSDFMRGMQVCEMVLSIPSDYTGDGIRLFQSGSPDIPMKLTKMQQYGQIDQLHYQRKK